MRSIGVAQYALDLMIQRVTDPSRKTFGKYLYEHGACLLYTSFSPEPNFLDEGTVIADIATSRAEIEASRLLVLSAAHQVSLLGPTSAVVKLASLLDRQVQS